jgi:hypothetical protein
MEKEPHRTTFCALIDIATWSWSYNQRMRMPADDFEASYMLVEIISDWSVWRT